MFNIIEKLKRYEKFNQIQDIKPGKGHLKELGDIYLQEFINYIQSIQNDLLMKSTKIRKIDGLAYRDGASDMCDIIKKGIRDLKKGSIDIRDPLTGEKIKQKRPF